MRLKVLTPTQTLVDELAMRVHAEGLEGSFACCRVTATGSRRCSQASSASPRRRVKNGFWRSIRSADQMRR
ncbi:MAG: hypothetical protein R3F37_18105 [Candidatus Competibacteraceae bacterium]